MDGVTLIRVIAGVAAAVVFMFIVWRRRRQASE
jgi:hypothetical protein